MEKLDRDAQKRTPKKDSAKAQEPAKDLKVKDEKAAEVKGGAMKVK